jgi:hypothetical protein
LQNFSLIDDGQVLLQSSSYLEDCYSRLECSKFIDQTFELGSGRFRPSYWLINNSTYGIFHNNAQSHHVFRACVIGYFAILLLTLVLIDLEIHWLFVFTGVMLFMTNFSFSENIIRLGTNEPYQVVFLALFSLLYLNREKMHKAFKLYFPLLVLLLIWAVLIKENNIAVLPAVFLTEFFFNNRKISKKNLVLVGIPAFILVLGIFVSKLTPSVISLDIPVYTSNYVTDIRVIFKNSLANVRLLLNSMSPFLKLTLIISPFLYINKKIRRTLKQKKFYYWIFFSTFFTIILFPWRHVLERYQLVAIFGLTVVTMFLLNQVFIYAKDNFLPQTATTGFAGGALSFLSFVLIMNTLSRGLPVNLAKTLNYRDWFSVFTTFEKDQIEAIAKYKKQKIYINAKENINNWEVLYEIPIHLKFLYNLSTKTEVLKGELPKEGYIFSRSPFDLEVPLNELDELGYHRVDHQLYSVDQIDPIEYRKSFILRPIQTTLSAPIIEDKHEYYWEIRELAK